MPMPTRAAAVVAAASLALTPTAAIAAKAHHHPSARATCRALRKHMGVTKFDAKFGTGPKHRKAMARCVALHKTKTMSSTTG